MKLRKIYENHISEFIRYGEFDPSDKGLSLVWQELSKDGAAELLSDAINGDELLSKDVLNWAFFKDAGDQGRCRISQALSKHAMYFVEKDADLIWSIWEGYCQPDPMDLGKNSYMDDIADCLKGVF